MKFGFFPPFSVRDQASTPAQICIPGSGPLRQNPLEDFKHENDVIKFSLQMNILNCSMKNKTYKKRRKETTLRVINLPMEEINVVQHKGMGEEGNFTSGVDLRDVRENSQMFA